MEPFRQVFCIKPFPTHDGVDTASKTQALQPLTDADVFRCTQGSLFVGIGSELEKTGREAVLQAQVVRLEAHG